MVFFLLCSVSLTFRLLYVQLLQNSRYTQLAAGQRLRPTTIDPKRGRILDRNLATLAMSVETGALYAIPRRVSHPMEVARILSHLLNRSYEELYGLLTLDQETVWIDRKLSLEVQEEILALSLPGLRIQSRPQRYYPHGMLAAHVLGIAGIDNQGLEGIELQYEALLKGIPGTLERERDAARRDIPLGQEHFVPPLDGHDIILTIDQTLQYIAESELKIAVLATKSAQGVILMVCPYTGEILANAVFPTFDPNSYALYPRVNRRNIAVTDQFEPGSTFKAFTTVAALQEKIVSPATLFPNVRVWEVGGGRVHNVSALTGGEKTFARAFQESDNVVFARLATQLGPEVFYGYLQSLGFGTQTGVDFPGEARGTVARPGSIQHGETLQWANIGFGQGIAVTPLQMVMALSALVNGGSLMTPYYVAEVRDIYGKVVQKTTPKVSSVLFEESTIEQIQDLLRQAVMHGTGNRAEILGFPVAGKTGTAEIPEAGGYGEKRIASFMGFAPYEDPRLAMIVILYDPEVEPRFGGVLAAPVFQRVMEQSLDYLGVVRKQPLRSQDNIVVVPNVRNFALLDALASLQKNSLQASYSGQGALVFDQTPAPGSRVLPHSTVTLFFHLEEELPYVTVPDVLGRSMRDVSSLVSELGLRIRVSGSGVAKKQNPEAGHRVPIGSVMEVEFGP